MSILEKLKLKGDRTTFDKLSRTFPSEQIEPYGRVMVISAKNFRSEWKEQLEAEGVKIYLTSHAGQSCFLLRAAQASVQKSEADPKPSPVGEGSKVKPVVPEAEHESTLAKAENHDWTPDKERMLKQFHDQGLNAKQIAERLGLNVFSVCAKLRYLKPKIKPQQKRDKTTETAAQASLEDSLIKEFLQAASVLYPQYRHASAHLLKQAADKMEN